MDNNREKILDKIAKCMALAASGNEHEAAAALRQAQALMKSHKVTQDEMLSLEITEDRAKSDAYRTPPNWENVLASKIAKMFGCRLVFDVGGMPGPSFDSCWTYVGVAPGPQVAAYAMSVLYRQAKRARAEHVATLKRFKRKNKIAKADLFCDGWVAAATAAIDPWVSSQAGKDAMDAYFRLTYPSLGQLLAANRNAGRDLSRRDLESYHAGRDAGRKAELNRGIAGSAPVPALEGL